MHRYKFSCVTCGKVTFAFMGILQPSAVFKCFECEENEARGVIGRLFKKGSSLPSSGSPLICRCYDCDHCFELKDYEQPQERWFNEGICWGGETRVFVEGCYFARRLSELRIGDQVFTAKGHYRSVQRIWVTRIAGSCRLASSEVRLCRYNGYWTTSHHPVLVQDDVHNFWAFPGDLVPSALARESPAVVAALPGGYMYDVELEGHDDTICLGADDGSDQVTVACCLGKYLGPSGRAPWNVFTRCTVPCNVELSMPGSCAQCAVALEPGLRFDSVSKGALRWNINMTPFPSVEWPNWAHDGAGGCENLNFPALMRRLKASHSLQLAEESWQPTSYAVTATGARL